MHVQNITLFYTQEEGYDMGDLIELKYYDGGFVFQLFWTLAIIFSEGIFIT